MRPYLECCIQLWSPQHKKGMDLFEGSREDNQRARAPLLPGQTDRAGVAQPEEEKALGRSNCGLLMSKGAQYLKGV